MDEQQIKYILDNTKILRFPKRKIATFGTTNVNYYLIAELMENVVEIRKGKILVERPLIIPPPGSEISNRFEGFGNYQNSRVFLSFFRKYMRGLYYNFKFRNELEETSMVYNSFDRVMKRVNEMVDKQEKSTGIIKGIDVETGIISLTKFIKKLVEVSAEGNIIDLEERDFFEKAGYEKIKFKKYKELPHNLKVKIDKLFKKTREGKLKVKELEAELIELGVYHLYREKLLNFFKKE